MPTYEHKCRACDIEWLEDYSLEVFDKLKAAGDPLTCPECESEDCYRCVGQTPVHFKGAGWSPQGYSKDQSYEQLEREGKKVTLYDRREDLQRVMRGEKAEATKARLKREDSLAKKYMGPDSAMSQAQADKRIKAAVDKVE